MDRVYQIVPCILLTQHVLISYWHLSLKIHNEPLMTYKTNNVDKQTHVEIKPHTYTVSGVLSIKPLLKK